MAPHLDDDRALFVLALADDDEEKRAALAHARECASCQQVLDEAAAMLSLFDGLGADDALIAAVAITPELEARVQRAVYPQSALAKRLAQLGLLLGALLSAWMVWNEADTSGPAQMPVGVHCFFYELGFAAASLTLGLVVGRRYLASFGPWQGAFMAMSGSLIGQAILQVRCEAQGAWVHLLLFHALGVVVATLLGGTATRAFERVGAGAH